MDVFFLSDIPEWVHSFSIKRKQVLWGLRENGEGGGNIFQFTELGGARCVEDS